MIRRLQAAWRALFNRYEAIRWNPSRSLISAPLQDASRDISKHTREQLQIKARYFEKNSDLFNKLADIWEQYTVGGGLQIIPASSDEEWNTLARSIWAQWKQFCDISSRFSFDTLQGVISRGVFVDGEHFVILTREGQRPRIQLVEGHNCLTPPARADSEGKTIFDGVEVDRNGRPMAYWFRFGETFQRFDASFVIPVFEPARAGQLRGLPYITPGMNTLHDLDDLQILEMKAAKDAAEVSNIFKTSTGNLPGRGFQANRLLGTTTAGDGTVINDERIEYYRQASGGRSIALLPGDDAVQFASNRPSVVTQDYWRKLEEKVCAAVGIPYVMVYPDSMQGTVYRGALDAAAAFFRIKSAVMAGHFQRIYEFVINQEGFLDRRLANRPVDWRKTVFRAPRAPNVDIGRNSNALLTELAAGVRDWDSIAAETGDDAREIVRRKADFLVYLRQLADERGLQPEQIASADLPKFEAATMQPQFPNE